MVLCGPETRDYLINYARSLIYTTALGFPFLASIRTAYELLSSGETESVRPSVTLRFRLLISALVPTQSSTIDSPSSTTSGFSAGQSVRHVRGGSFPDFPDYFTPYFTATRLGGRLSTRWIHCSCHYATDHPGGQRARTGVSSCWEYGRTG